MKTLNEIIKNMKRAHFYVLKHFLIIVVFALLYFLSNKYVDNNIGFKKHNHHTDNKNITFVDCLFFSLVTQTTVGYGNLVSVDNTLCKFINIIQLITLYITIVVDLI